MSQILSLHQFHIKIIHLNQITDSNSTATLNPEGLIYFKHISAGGGEGEGGGGLDIDCEKSLFA